MCDSEEAALQMLVCKTKRNLVAHVLLVLVVIFIWYLGRIKVSPGWAGGECPVLSLMPSSVYRRTRRKNAKIGPETVPEQFYVVRIPFLELM